MGGKKCSSSEKIDKRNKEDYGLKFIAEERPFYSGALGEIFIQKLYDDFKITKKDVVYDLGATAGEYSLLCASKGATCLAFEINKSSFELMVRHIDLNGFKDKIFPFLCKISENESVDFFVKKTGKIPTLIKIDIEGAEVEALKGAKKTLKKYKPRIILETHSKELKKDCFEILKDFGYKCILTKILDKDIELHFLK